MAGSSSGVGFRLETARAVSGRASAPEARPARGSRSASRVRLGTALALVVVVVVSMGGCALAPSMAPDAGAPRDAALAEGGLVRSDGGAADAGRTPEVDAGLALGCAPGVCEPGEACGDGGVCSLDGPSPTCEAPRDGAPAGSACEVDDACVAGLSCFRSLAGDGAMPGICARPCCPWAESACGEGARCRADGVLTSGVDTTWGRCAPRRACDVRAPDCAAREACYLDPSTGGSECLVAGAVDVGGACARPEACAPGLVCAGLAAQVCARLCVLGGAACPPGEGACVAQAYTPEGVGVCVSTAGR